MFRSCSNRISLSFPAVVLLLTIGSCIKPSSASLPLPKWFIDAFNDVNGSGLAVSGGASPTGSDKVASVSILTKNLPLGLFTAFASSSHGVVFRPGALKSLCSFPVNGNTNFRQNVGPAANSNLDSHCGVFPEWEKYEEEYECAYSPEEYASKFYNYPLSYDKSSFNPLASFIGKWQLTGGTCHFKDISTMLRAEQALLERCLTPPSDMWLFPKVHWNLRLESSGPTLWNEVVVAPFSSDAVAGIFWAHTGSFRKPQKDDFTACQAALSLKTAGGKLPVFEFANFPFDFYFNMESLTAWSETLQAGGYQVSQHFRLMNSTEVLALLESDLCNQTGTAAVII